MCPFGNRGEDFQQLSFGPRETAMFKDMLGIPFENHDPEITNVGDQEMLEDGTLIVQLEISDADEDFLHFEISSDEESVEISLEEDLSLNILPAPNWYGNAHITLIASDPFGGADTLGFSVEVQSINDIPERFSLISPRNNFTETDTSSIITFRWESSHDEDGDTLFYGLVLRGIDFAETVETLLTEYEIPAHQFPWNEEIRWSVWVTDREDTVRTSERHFQIHVNRAPMLAHIGNQEMSEDEELTMHLSATDPDDDDISFFVESSEDSVRTRINNEELTLLPQANWFGETIISITASDGDLFDTLSFRLRVAPVNDAPSNFSLVSPRNNFVTHDTRNEIFFLWDNSHDADGDTVSYRLYLKNENGDEHVFEISDNMYEIPKEDLPHDENIRWCVWASDGIDSTMSEEERIFRIEPPNSVSEENIPLSFFLDQNHPNPFNSTTTIQYGVANMGQVEITIYDISGREICVPVKGILSAGKYAFSFHAEGLSTGTYFIVMKSADFHSIRQMVLLH